VCRVAGSLLGSRVVANWDQSSPPVPNRPRQDAGRCHRSGCVAVRSRPQTRQPRTVVHGTVYSVHCTVARSLERSSEFSAVERMTGARRPDGLRQLQLHHCSFPYRGLTLELSHVVHTRTHHTHTHTHTRTHVYTHTAHLTCEPMSPYS
jgi:hypothetical protein